jgi:hypothetical protein
VGDRKRDVGRREEVGVGTGPQDQQGPGAEGRPGWWARLGLTLKVCQIGVGAKGRRDAEAEIRGSGPQAIELDSRAEERRPPLSQSREPQLGT